MISSINLFSDQTISADGTATKDIILEHIPDTSNIWIDVQASDGTGIVKGEWWVRDSNTESFYHPSNQGDLFTGHTSTTNTNGRDRYAISSPFLAKEVRIKFIETGGADSIKITSDLIVG